MISVCLLGVTLFLCRVVLSCFPSLPNLFISLPYISQTSHLLFRSQNYIKERAIESYFVFAESTTSFAFSQLDMKPCIANNCSFCCRDRYKMGGTPTSQISIPKSASAGQLCIKIKRILLLTSSSYSIGQLNDSLPVPSLICSFRFQALHVSLVAPPHTMRAFRQW
jgi:hypothetical protein